MQSVIMVKMKVKVKKKSKPKFNTGISYSDYIIKYGST